MTMKIILCSILGLVAGTLGFALLVALCSIIGWPAYRLFEGEWGDSPVEKELK